MRQKMEQISPLHFSITFKQTFRLEISLPFRVSMAAALLQATSLSQQREQSFCPIMPKKDTTQTELLPELTLLTLRLLK
jgi:hypothetical protein